MVYYSGAVPYSKSLQHHGILGMKWGVRRYQNPDGTLTAAGKTRYSDGPSRKQRRAQKTYDRIKSVRNDEARMDRMSARQKESLKRSEKYWKERSEGKTPSQKRNFIKREADRYRSLDKKKRYAKSYTANLAIAAGSTAVRVILAKRSGLPVAFTPASVGKAFVQTALSTAGGMLVSELLYSKAAGHY